MKSKLALGTIIISFAACTSTQKATVTAPVEAPQPTGPYLSSGVDSFSYALGATIGKTMRRQGIDTIDTDKFLKALQDNCFDDTSLLNDEVVNQTLQEKLQAFAQQKVDKEKAAAKAFLDENKTRTGVVTLPSGLQYEIIKEGTGKKPTAEDVVQVHYTGKLINGEVFDSSEKTGQPISMAVTRFIKGWIEALQLMPVGSKWKLYIPSDLGYGDMGSRAIPPGATLIFDIELLDIVQQ